MNILILGDVVGSAGRKALTSNLPNLIKKKKLDFVIVNGENAADSGVGITKKNAEDFLNAGTDVITSGNHIWDEKETMEFISSEKRLLRPENLISGSPGNGKGIFISKNNKRVAVINLMGNVFMKKCEDVFQSAKKFIELVKLKRDADFMVVDMHAEITSEKMAMGHFFDGKATMVVGTHTHVPTSDHRILEKGTAYQTDVGMCGDYNSVIGMNRDNSLKRFLKDSSAKKHYPASGEATISGLMVSADKDTGLAKKVEPIIVGGALESKI
ncbi:MAG: TIGR00282 family metallophosphoesterase [Candidatus Pelagibacterales bacterium]|nr:MAG: TIGR00282 family metallophosphoesterase [Pelagibacterales bacterium]